MNHLKCKPSTTYHEILDFITVNKDNLVEIEYDSLDKNDIEVKRIKLDNEGIKWIKSYMGNEPLLGLPTWLQDKNVYKKNTSYIHNIKLIK